MIARGTRRGRSCAAMLTAVSLLCAPQTVLAQGDAPYWMSAYQGTFVADACGDAALGHAWRRAYRALVAECPFSNASSVNNAEWPALQRVLLIIE